MCSRCARRSRSPPMRRRAAPAAAAAAAAHLARQLPVLRAPRAWPPAAGSLGSARSAPGEPGRRARWCCEQAWRLRGWHNLQDPLLHHKNAIGGQRKRLLNGRPIGGWHASLVGDNRRRLRQPQFTACCGKEQDSSPRRLRSSADAERSGGPPAYASEAAEAHSCSAVTWQATQLGLAPRIGA